MRLLICFFLTSCTVHPFVHVAADGSKTISTGGSLITKTTDQTATVKDGDLEITYTMKGKNETGVALAGITAWGLVSAADIQAGVDKVTTQEATKVTGIKSKEAVKIKAIESETAVKLATP